MTTQTHPVQWRESYIAQEDYPIRERFPRLRRWQPLPPLASVGTRRHSVEAFGADRRYLVNIVDRVLHLDETGILLSKDHAGMWIGRSNLLAPVPFRFSTLEHQFFAHPPRPHSKVRASGKPGRLQ